MFLVVGNFFESLALGLMPAFIDTRALTGGLRRMDPSHRGTDPARGHWSPIIGKLPMCTDDASEVGNKKMTALKTAADVAGTDPSSRVQGGLEPQLQDHIGIQLRAVFNEILNEPVPGRFLQLLADLERKQADKS